MSENTTPAYQWIANKLQAIENCRNSDNAHWLREHQTALEDFLGEHLPSGSGFDNGTSFDQDASSPDKLVFHTAFHHMSDVGMYVRWTEHTVTVTPSFVYGMHMRVTGSNYRDIKDYVAETFSSALSLQVPKYAKPVTDPVEAFLALDPSYKPGPLPKPINR